MPVAAYSAQLDLFSSAAPFMNSPSSIVPFQKDSTRDFNSRLAPMRGNPRIVD